MIRWFLPAVLAVAATSVAAQAASTDLPARMQLVEDELAIQKILVNYAAYLDGRDYARYSDLFTLDGEWKNAGGSHKGRAEIRQMLESVMGPAGSPNLANYHVITNPRVALDGDRAAATSRYLFVMRGPDGQPTPSLAGVYHDELVRQGGVWKIKRRVADDIMPTPEEWRKIIAAQQATK
jgi:ketosteroid isomerase-like protein